MLIVDPASGVMWKIDKYADDINETMIELTALITEPTLKIMNIKEVPQDMKGISLALNNLRLFALVLIALFCILFFNWLLSGIESKTVISCACYFIFFNACINDLGKYFYIRL